MFFCYKGRELHGRIVKMRALVVEDEVKTARFLEKGLTENGFTVDVLHDGGEAQMVLQNQSFDLLIIDVVLPTLSGIDLVKEFRKKDSTTPVLMLTARDSVQDKVAGIESGASVYLVKPFSFSEVLAYARSLTQKRANVSNGVLKCLDLEVDLNRQKVKRGGHAVDLTAKEFSLLSLLLSKKGQILSRTLIAEQVWGLNFDPGTNVVDVHIRRLRAKIDDAFEKKLIWTARGSGYVLEEREEPTRVPSSEPKA